MNSTMKLGVLCLVMCGSIACRNQATSEVLTELTADSQQPEPQPFIFSIERKDRTSVDIITGEGEFKYSVDWDNDGTYDEISVQGPVSHDYKEPGTYTIRIRGQFPHMLARGDKGVNLCGMKVLQWGDIQWKSMKGMFAGCFISPTFPDTDAPDLSHVIDMSGMFAYALLFNQPLDHWDVSHVTDMGGMFGGAKTFNQPLNSWNTKNVTGMSGMFNHADAFNQPLDAWDTSNVTDMNAMFLGAKAFNQPLNSWNTSDVMDMRWMFSKTKAFNQPLSSWDTSNVTTMAGMFARAKVFNQPLDSWDVSSVEKMSEMLNKSSMDTQNYDATLQGWAKQLPMEPRKLSAEGLTYCKSTDVRQELIDAGWKIMGDTKKCD
mgnify:CR=1 FL=1